MIPRSGCKPVDVAVLKHSLNERSTWCGLGLVVKRDGDSSHWQIVTNDDGSKDVHVEVDLMPDGTPVTARLASFGGMANGGLWKVPAVGTEVAWICPNGRLESDVMLVGTLSTGAVPAALDEDTLVIINPKRVVIASKDDKVFLGSEDGSGTKPVACKDHRVNLGTWTHTPASGTGVTPCKLLWNAPGSIDPPTEVTLATELDGKIKEGSATTEAKP